LNIGMITSWGVRCGVAGYTKQLVTALEKEGDQVTVFGNFPHESLVEKDDGKVIRCFGTGFNEASQRVMDIGKIFKEVCNKNIDVVHLQYNAWLFPDLFRLKNLFGCLVNRGIRTVVEFHDSCIPIDFPFDLFTSQIVHGSDFRTISKGNYRIPMGIPEVRYVPTLNVDLEVCSFGMGRNDEDLCRKACEAVGYIFEVHDSRQSWKSLQELVSWIQKYNIVVLMYPPTDVHVSSSAVRIALGARRYVIVSDTNWFSDVGEFVRRVPFGDRRELEKALVSCDRSVYESRTEKAVEKWGWGRVVKYFKEVYDNEG